MLNPEIIGQILVDNTSLTQEQLQEALRIAEDTNEFIGRVLVNLGYITEKENAICLGMQWGVPFVDLEETEVNEEAARLVPESMMRRHKCIPIDVNGGKLTVAMSDPINILAIDQIRVHTNYEYEIEPVIATDEDIMAAIARLTSAQARVTEALQSVLDQMPDEDVGVEEQRPLEELSLDEAEFLSGEPPVVKLVSMSIGRAVRQGASDIHVQPEEREVRVRYRIDGMLRDEMSIPKSAQAAVISRIKVMANMKIDQKMAPQGGRIGLIIGGRDYDFRVSTLPGQWGEKVVMRILDRSSISVGLSKLGFSSETLQEFERMITRAYGIILVTGPTGSGKSTTLYSALERINTPEKNILTVEDPVEYEVPGLTQCQVNERAGMTFSSVLREMLRQDPDIIMVGEIRDRETAVIATEAALTGHLVLSTLHTNDSAGAVSRLIEMGVEPFLVSSSVIGVLAQRLVRKICQRCRQAYTPPREAFELVGLNAEDHADVVFYHGRGCDFCHDGYRGRTGIYELLPIDATIRDMILQRAPAHRIQQHAIENFHMTTLQGDVINKVLQGTTTLEEAYRVTHVD